MPKHTQHRPARGFTLVELLVAVSLLVLVILGISAVFATSSRAIRASHASAETDASARAMLRQIAQDVARIDRDGFLVIRAFGGSSPSRYQLAFLAHGAFANRTGGSDPQASPYAGDLTSHSAHVWYGHANTPEDYDKAVMRVNTGGSISQDDTCQLMDVPLGTSDIGQRNNLAVLARHTFALMPADVAADATKVLATGGMGAVPAHPDISRLGAAVSVGPAEPAARPTSGRTSVASITAGQLMARIRFNKYLPISVPATDYFGLNGQPNYGGGSSPFSELDGGFVEPLAPGAPLGSKAILPAYDGADYWYEARYYCYRFRTLRRPLDGVNASNQRDVINGLYRMNTTMLKNCTSFIVDWTDGSVDSGGNLRWSGMPNSLRLWAADGVPTPDVTNQDLFRSIDVKPPVWPPVDAAMRTFMTGSPNIARSADSMFGTLADKDGELRNVVGYTANGTVPGAPWDYYYKRDKGSTHDVYNALFSFDNRKAWPKAIRVSITVDMAGAETPNMTSVISKPERVYSQIMWLPE